MVPWKTLESVTTKEGALQLRQRGPREFLITIDGRCLMTSEERTSEKAVATLACEKIRDRKSPRVLIGGLGMAYTVRAALDALPKSAHVVVAELTPQVEAWNRGPLAVLTNSAIADPRVEVVIEDVSKVIVKAAAGSLDAIVLDLYEGPHEKYPNDPFYGRAALDRDYEALAPGGVLSIWSEEENAAFKKRLAGAGFATTVHKPGGSRAYVVYLAVKPVRK